MTLHATELSDTLIAARPNTPDFSALQNEAGSDWDAIRSNFEPEGSLKPQIQERDQIKPIFDRLKTVDTALTNVAPSLNTPALGYSLSTHVQEIFSRITEGFKAKVFDVFFGEFFKDTKVKAEGVTTVVDDAFVDSVYQGGLAAFKQGHDYDRYNGKFKQTIELLKHANDADGGLEYFQWLDLDGVIQKSMDAANEMADHIKNDMGCDRALIMGMGGSSMFPKIMNEVFSEDPRTQDFALEVMDGTDSASLQAKFKKLGLTADNPSGAESTALVFISKSGGTLETKHVIQSTLDRLTELHGGDKEAALKQFAKQAVFVTEPGNGALRKLALSIGKRTGGIVPTIVEHPERVGGRFSAFSVVGMLPAALKNLETSEFKRGAQAAIQELFDAANIDDSDVGKLALHDLLAAQSGNYAGKFVASYTDRLKQVGGAKEQEAGESNCKGDEGKKNGVYALPVINTTGPLFQHSTIEGTSRTDRLRMVFEQILTKQDQADMVHNDHDLPELADIARTSLHQETITKLALPFAAHLRDNRENPVITTILSDIDEYNIGYLLMRDMLTTVVQAGLQDNTNDAWVAKDQTIPVNLVQLGHEVPRTLENNVLRSVYQDGVEAFKTDKAKLTPDAAKAAPLTAAV